MPNTEKNSHSTVNTPFWNYFSHIAGPGFAGILEVGIFHPYDTIAKRLMRNESVKIPNAFQHFRQYRHALNQVIFKEAYNRNYAARYTSLYAGIKLGVGYKIAQRIVKFASQPLIKQHIEDHYGRFFQRTLGDKHAKVAFEATAGSLAGMAEIIVLPLDALKVKAQTNAGLVQGKTLVQLVKEEKFKLYNGASWTILRNAPGSFFLFGTSAFVKEYVFHLENYKDATFTQNVIASSVGATASIVFSNPIDVVKTRIQANKNPEPGRTIIKNMIKNEGMTSFFKGTLPKVLAAGPKVAFTMTIAPMAIDYFNDLVKHVQHLSLFAPQKNKEEKASPAATSRPRKNG